MSAAQKKPFIDAAEQEAQAHKLAFPDYQYQPRRAAKGPAGEALRPSITSNAYVSGTTTSAAASKWTHIPRPRNAFFIFREMNLARVKSELGSNSHSATLLSKEFGKQWKALSNSNRAFYSQKASEEKKRHQTLYPEYEYQPKRKTLPASPSQPVDNSTMNAV